MARVSPKEKHRGELLGKSLSLLLGIRSRNSVPQFLPAQVLVSFSSQIPHFCAMHFLSSITLMLILKHIMGDITACRDARQLQCALGSTCFQTLSHSSLAPLQLCPPGHPPTGAQPPCQPTTRASTSQSSLLTLRGRERNICIIYLAIDSSPSDQDGQNSKSKKCFPNSALLQSTVLLQNTLLAPKTLLVLYQISLLSLTLSLPLLPPPPGFPHLCLEQRKQR